METQQKIRVIVQFMGGNYVNVYFHSRGEASQFIADWVKRHEERQAQGVDKLEIVKHHYPTEEPQAAFVGKYAVGMYIPDDTPHECANDKLAAAQLKIAEAMEKEFKREDWRGEEE